MLVHALLDLVRVRYVFQQGDYHIFRSIDYGVRCCLFERKRVDLCPYEVCRIKQVVRVVVAYVDHVLLVNTIVFVPPVVVKPRTRSKISDVIGGRQPKSASDRSEGYVNVRFGELSIVIDEIVVPTIIAAVVIYDCLLYTSDAADE